MSEDKLCACSESSHRRMGKLSHKRCEVILFDSLLLSGDVAHMCNLKPLRGSKAEQNK